MLHIGILAFMLWVLDLGIDGVVLSNVIFYIMMCVFNQLSIRHILQYRQEYIKTFVCPLFSSAVMGLAASILYRVIHALIPTWYRLPLLILVAVVVCAVLMLLTRGRRGGGSRQLSEGKNTGGNRKEAAPVGAVR